MKRLRAEWAALIRSFTASFQAGLRGNSFAHSVRIGQIEGQVAGRRILDGEK